MSTKSAYKVQLNLGDVVKPFKVTRNHLLCYRKGETLIVSVEQCRNNFIEIKVKLNEETKSTSKRT